MFKYIKVRIICKLSIWQNLSSVFRELTKILSETNRRPIGDPLQTRMSDWRPIGEQHAWSETHRIPISLIGERHVGDSSEKDMSDWRPTCLIRYQYAWLETHRRPTCLIRHVQWVSNEAWHSPMRHASLRWVSDQACRSPMGLRSDM